MIDKAHESKGLYYLFNNPLRCVLHDFDSIQQALPIPHLSSVESLSFETHNQDILQPFSSVHSQIELSPPSISTCQSRTQEMGTPVCEDPLDSCPLSSTDPALDPPSSSPSHDSNIALDHLGWQQAMVVEMQTLEQSGTWKLVSLPSCKKAAGCRWVFAIKVGRDGTVDRLKARLVAKGYTRTKDLGHPKYFLGIEVVQSKEDIVISQRKYALDILQETSMSNCRPVDNPMDPNMKLMISWMEKFLQKGTEITAPVPMAPPGTTGLGGFEVPLSKGSTLRSDASALNVGVLHLVPSLEVLVQDFVRALTRSCGQVTKLLLNK
ncbi:Pantothenate kinase 2, partial [Mucuna pruriens]